MKQDNKKTVKRIEFGRHPHEFFHLVLPLPAATLSPNVRVHWSKKAKAVRNARMMAYIYSRQGQRPGWPTATARCVFYHCDRRRRDTDNLLASLKAAFDGITDAGIVVDDVGLTHKPVERRVDRNNPRVEIIIEPKEAEA